MTRADYESRFDTIQITLGVTGDLGGGSDVIENGAVIVSYAGGQPAVIDVLGTGSGFEKPLRVAAERNGLDPEALFAIAQAAIAAPDRQVTLDVGARAAA